MFPDPSLLPFFQSHGYEAPPTLMPPFSSPFLEIGNCNTFDGFEFEPLALAPPSQLMLRVRLEGIPMTPPSPLIQAIVEEEALSPVALYTYTPPSQPWAAQARYASIHLLYTGEGFYWDTLTWVPLQNQEGPGFSLKLVAGALLYAKLFAYERSSHVIESTHRLPNGKIQRTPPTTLKRLFRPFGGWLNKKTQTAEQVYYEIGEVYPSQTTITLYPESQLPSEEILFWPIPTPEEQASLDHAVRKGTLSFQLLGSEPILYRSHKIHARTPQHLDILFISSSTSL